jgi:hypothetical protein
MKEVNFTNNYIQKRSSGADEAETSVIIETLKSRSRERRSKLQTDVAAASLKLEAAK